MTTSRSPVRLVVYTDATGYGGAEVQLRYLIGALDSRYRVTVVAVDQSTGERIASSRAGAQLQILPSVRGKWDLVRIGGTFRALRALQPDLVVTNHRHPYSAQYGLAAALALPNVKTVAVHHLPLAPSSSLQVRLVGALMRRTDAVVAVGRRSARELEGLIGLPRGSVRVIHNGVPDITLSPPPRPFDGPIIGSIGRLVPQKGYDRLIPALTDLPEASLVIVGDGEERGNLLAQADALGVASRVRIVDSPAEPRDWLGAFDVFVLPSRYESFPLSILQAMLAERPVVTTDVGSIAEAVTDEETGFLVDPDDAGALVRTIRRALCSEGARAAARARTVALEQFGVEAMTERYDTLFQDLLIDPGVAQRLPAA